MCEDLQDEKKCDWVIGRHWTEYWNFRPMEATLNLMQTQKYSSQLKYLKQTKEETVSLQKNLRIGVCLRKYIKANNW